MNQVHGYTLRSDWLNHTADTGGSWEGSYYNPPGALITFGPLSGVTTSTGGATQPYGITLTRSDKDGNGAPVAWTTTSGTTTTPISSETLKLLYQPLPSTTSNPDTNGIGYLQSSTESASDPTNVVIYASGNVRVRGILSSAAGPAVHITVVTNGIAYIDGSVLKGNPASSIAILAKSYVCLNTTQFLAGAADLNTSVTSVASSVGPPPALTFSNAESIDEEGLYETPTASQLVNPSTTYAYRLYLSQSSGGTNLQSSGLINNMQLSGYVDSPYNSSDLVTGTTPVRDVISLPATVGGATIAAPVSDTPFTLTFSKDPQYTSDWLVQKAAILPGDVQIQAVLYAQDDSFFVIPGDWFNTDSADTLTHAFDRLTSDPLTRDPRYPFYGQPIDLQITINGAVSENVPADISDQAAWMQKWGWIPVYHGLVPGTGGAVTMAAQDQSPHSLTPTIGVSANVPQIGIGLNLSYDHTVGFPYILNGTGSTATITYLRQDRFGRPLPFAPALPVSPDLLYSGRPTS